MTRHTTPGLYWPIKRSFVAYVLRIADGQLMGSPEMTVVDSGTFVFAPADDDATETPADVWSFRGEIRMQAHNGQLGVRIANPRVEFGVNGTDEAARILIEDPEGSTRSVPLVTFVATTESEESGLQRWTGSDVRLAVEAVPLFGGYYGEGEPFDDLTMVAAAR